MKKNVFFSATAIVALLGSLHTTQAADLLKSESEKETDNRARFLGIPIGGASFPDRYVPPITNPLFNESPYIVSEGRFVYLYNSIPDSFPDPALGIGGGNIQAAAGATRLRLTDRLAFIATKDGYAVTSFDSPLLDDDDGFVNIAGGLKYALWEDKATKSIFTVGLKAELSIQELATLGGAIDFQGAGGLGFSFLNPFVSAATVLTDAAGPLEGVQLQGSFGLNLALHPDLETSIAHFSLHANYELFDNFFPVIELNGFVPISRGERFTADPLNQLDGVDLANFGSSDRGTTITAGGGFRYNISENAQFGLGGEVALTDTTNSILDWRITADFGFNF